MRFAFLRAVNLGAKNKVPMKELVAALRAAGLGDVAHLLQSGNLAFAAPPPDPELRGAVEALVAQEFGVSTRVVLRAPTALAATLALNPFAGGGNVHLAMWDEEPAAGGLAALEAEEFGVDELRLVPGAAFMSYASTSHDSRLSNALLERRLKVPSTARNLRTLLTMLERWPA